MGLDPDDESVDEDSPIGIGNLAGQGVIDGRINDGFNEEGYVGRQLRPKPFRDYTGYVPVRRGYTVITCKLVVHKCVAHLLCRWCMSVWRPAPVTENQPHHNDW